MIRKLYILCAVLLMTAGTDALGQNLKPSVTYNRLQREDAGLPVIGRIQPVASSLGRESLWSVGCETLDRDYAVFDNFKQYVAPPTAATAPSTVTTRASPAVRSSRQALPAWR